MQLVSHRPSQSWEARLQFNGLPADVNVKGIARTQVQQLGPQHALLINSQLLINTGMGLTSLSRRTMISSSEELIKELPSDLL